MKVQIVISLVLVFFSNMALSQQQSMFTHYMFNSLSVNPAYSTQPDNISLNVLHRSQWAGVEGSPTTQTLTMTFPVKNKNIGIGTSVTNDKIGPISQLFLAIDFAYKINLTNDLKLSFGLKSSFSNLNLGLSEVPNINPNDPMFSSQLSSGFKPNFGTGIYLNNDKFYIGVSTPNLMENTVTNDVISYQNKRHFYLLSGGVFKLSDDLRLKPSLMIRGVENTPISIDLTSYIIFKDKFWLGAMHRVSESVGALAQYQINSQLRLGYSYDFIINSLKSGTGGSHEVILQYDFNFNENQFVSPRFF